MTIDPSFGGAVPAARSFLAPQAQENVYRWATVTGVAPLEVRFDGDTDPLGIPPDSLAGSLDIGTRVWCQLIGRRVLILGTGYPSDGAPLMLPLVNAGTTAWNKADYPGLRYIRVRVCGAGGAGGGAALTGAGVSSGGAGGSSGGYGESVLAASVLDPSYTITVGTAGAGASGAAGGDGGDSSFGALVAGKGGNGGGTVAASATANVSAGTIPTSGGLAGNIAVANGTPGGGTIRVSANQFVSGAGGNSVIGTGGQARGDTSVAGANGSRGGGGSGAVNLASQSARAGGNGGTGWVFVEMYF